MVEHGYDAYTTDALAKALGVSRATFFRYLTSKDEIIVTALTGPDSQFADAYTEAESAAAGSEWARLRLAVAPAIRIAEDQPDRQRARLQLIHSQPAVGAKLRRARAPQIESLAAAVAASGHDDFAAEVLAAATISALDRSWTYWAAHEGASLNEILDRSFATLADASQPSRG
jgi:AcrR family transcriptional regulator